MAGPRKQEADAPPNDLELSCPAEAGSTSFNVRQAGGRFKLP